MNVEIGTETPILLFWEYLFRNFGILPLQCGGKKDCMVLYTSFKNYSLSLAIILQEYLATQVSKHMKQPPHMYFYKAPTAEAVGHSSAPDRSPAQLS